MIKPSRSSAVLGASLLALFTLAGCGSSGGDIFGGGNPGSGSSYPSSNTSSTIRGTVDSVDLSSRSVLLTGTSGYNSMLSSGGGNSVRVYFDDRTTVEYQGRSYRPEDLDRGDQIDVRVSQSGNRLVADTMTVVYNVASNQYPNNTSSSGNYPNNSYPGGTYNSVVRGTVRYVDTSRRQIEVDTGSGRTTYVDYDNSTSVMFGGRNYMAADLERGDEVDIRTRDLGNGRMLATNVDVVRSVSGGGNGTYGSSGSSTYGNYSTIRGTVQYVDTSRREITLSQPSWTNFAGDPRNNSTVIIRYDTNSRVDVSGQLSPVENLERGDVVDVMVPRDSSTSNLWAQRILLVRNVRQ